MLQFERWKIWMIAGICTLGVLFALPNLFDRETVAKWPSFVPHTRVNLGLDLRGGVYLLYEANVSDVKSGMLKSLREDARSNLRNAKIGYTALGASDEGVRVRLLKPEDSERALTELRKLATTIGGSTFAVGAASTTVTREADGSILLVPTEPAVRARIVNGMSAAIETIRRRVDALGTTEPNIQRQGIDRIVIQVPGFDKPEELIKVIGQTAALAFHEVDRAKTPEEALASGPPPGSQVFDFIDEGKGKILLKSVPVVDGGDLVDAQAGFDQQTNEATVNFRFNTSGAVKFGKFTSEHLKQPFAIVLDGKAISAPVIQSAITQGSGQITGNFTPESANALAIQLRSGALPFKLEIKEQRTVGASLGADSIRAGTIAAIIGSVAVAAFMMLAYGLFGFFSVLGLVVNLLLLFAVMSILGQTLTLPGIAGIVLTAGMAVDSNVLIYERIREELRAGKSAIMAIEQGFQRAFVTVVDSHITTLVAGIIMFALGAGPIRGFAVSLTIGIAISVFTAFTFVRMLVVLWLRRQRQITKTIEVPV
jgi:protein-export membrane protein SecD